MERFNLTLGNISRITVYAILEMTMVITVLNRGKIGIFVVCELGSCMTLTEISNLI